MGQLLPPVALLLLVSASSRAADVPKAVVLLDPPWASVLQDDHVTLKCQGLHSAGDNATQWLHNGSLLSSQAPAYTITAAKPEDGGEYRCQTGLSSLSDPVQLRVHLGWLVLQAPRWVFQEGEPIQLRCHSWRNSNLHKVTYLQDGRGLRYFHQNSDLHIPEATRNHSGSYFCRGLIGHHNVSSETVTITVQGPANPVVSSSILPWHQIAFCLVMGLLLAADTGLYFSVQRDLQSSQRARKEHTLGWSLSPPATTGGEMKGRRQHQSSECPPEFAMSSSPPGISASSRKRPAGPSPVEGRGL